ncbi:TIGR00341 family protein [Ornithinibacillus halophilus]|uniref:TIGR00341 family protein n=1 Tax=Ornithinibacillus halophilus TaxID=930117 RepID=A0A1M5F3W5_9BACI|nr:TIGR00341 family protein [Ornithinibacillus halophilus]SHF86156.1 TIGR00341 family protein [Ornithinibacillus halophilus]
MDIQLIEAYVPNKFFEKVDGSLKEFPHMSYWVSLESKERKLIRVLVETKNTEEILNYFEEISNVVDGFEVLLFPVQTYIRRSTDEEEEKKRVDSDDEDENKLQRASRQELLGNIKKSSHITITYTLLVIISAVVVTIGFIQNSQAVIIGAMVIAPMLGPTIAIAFSSILGEFQLLRSSFTTLSFAILIVIGISILFTFFFPVPLESSEFYTRTHVNISDIVLALASGTAGALSILNRLPGSLVGVMVAVALLPPTVVLGMTIGSGMWQEAYGSGLLLLGNITSVILAAITVFSLSGIRPVKWDEVDRAKTSRKLSIVFVSVIIILLIIAILFSQHVDLV